MIVILTHFKLSDLTKSRSTKPLSKDLLSNNDGYSVYGGNGVIGFVYRIYSPREVYNNW